MSLIFTGTLLTYYARWIFGLWSFSCYSGVTWTLLFNIYTALSSPDTFLFLFSFPTPCHSLFCLCQGPRHTKTQWDMPGGNKDSSKAAGLCVTKSAAYPGATCIGSGNSSLILKKSHWRLSHVALRKLLKLTCGSFGLKIDGIFFDKEKRFELHCNSLLIGFEDLFDHLQRGVKQPFV